MAVKHLIIAGLGVLLSAPAFAQTTPTPPTVNDQLQWGDVFATMTVNAPAGSQTGASSSATAVGNTASASNLSGPLNLRSRQTFSGSARANATLDTGTADACCYAIAAATAQGNALSAQAAGGTSTIDADQMADGGDVVANARVRIGNTSLMTAAASAAQNNAATRVDNGDMDIALRQNSSASSFAAVDADACCAGQSVAAGSSAINAWSGVARTGTTRSDVTQNSTAATSQATVDLYQRNGVEAQAASSAAANSQTLDSQWGFAYLRSRQNSSTNVSAETRVTLDNWTGTAVASAYGVGNAILASNVGSDLQVDINQINTGGVSASTSFTGGTGGQAIVNAAAIGNAATAWVCSYCGDATASGTITQNNGGSITSTGTINVGANGGLVGSASAVGNSATFVTTQRHQ